ncbi:MAG: IS256 family transposase [Acidobacteria bacterium]|nr:IS256 family transposase [Acidobacteriota bacterium]
MTKPKPKMTQPNDKTIQIKLSEEASGVCRNVLEETLRSGAQRLLAEAIEREVEEYVQAHAIERDAHGHRLVVRNGHFPERKIASGIGPIEVKAPRVEDRREGRRFTSAILPPYLRKVPSLENLIPTLYLMGVSTSDMERALEALLGAGARGISASTVVRLKEVWQEEFADWKQRDLSGKHYVYLWVDGIYFNVRLDEARPCVLVVVGALSDGTKELVALQDGERESTQSWIELMVKLKTRGLREAPKLAIGDGALGFWPALEEQWPSCLPQRCWVHKTANVLDKLPKKQQSSAKSALHEIYLAATKADAEKAFDAFGHTYRDKFPKAWACLDKDHDQLLSFYHFPAAHWVHLRTTNAIESSFAMVRHRSRQTKGCGSREATLALVYKLGRECEHKWRRLNSPQLIDKVIRGVVFADGLELTQQAA